MTQESKRDKAMERLLKHTLPALSEAEGRSDADQAASRGRSAEACPEPEILAAYFDRLLAAPEVKHWEAHFSLCARCQEQLAALAASEPGVEARPTVAPQPSSERVRLVAPRWTWLWDWRWLAPAAAAAAAVALWVAIRPAPPQLELEFARVQTEREAIPPAAREEAVKRAPATPVSPVPAPAALGEKAQAPTKKDLAAHPPVTFEEKAKEVLGVAAEEARDVVLAQKAEVPQAVQVPALPAQEADKGRAGVVGGVADYKAEQRAVQDKMAPPQTQVAEKRAPVAPPAQRQEARQAEAQAFAERVDVLRSRAMLMSERPGEVRVATPNPAVLWRLGPAGKIERSTDSGKTWEGQDSRVPVDLLAGSAPSETVCWVVGRAGTVLLTTDGKRWEKLSSPTPADLLGIDASDALRAVVVAADGQTYETRDAGRTWRPR